MKIAKKEDGSSIEAQEDAPKNAFCPYCGGSVTLRRRKLMNSTLYSYFWRHRDNENLDCAGRSRRSG